MYSDIIIQIIASEFFKLTYDKQQIRTFLIQHHHLHKKIQNSQTLSLFNQLGCIQYDPLNITGRNADLVLQSRVAQYTPAVLENLLYKEKKLIDGWDKMMSIFPASDWPHMQNIREEREKGYKGYLEWRKLCGKIEDLAKEVLAIIEHEGEKKTSSFKSESIDNGSWGHRKLTSLALEYLYARGDLCISGKTGTQKSYDAAHRIIPKQLYAAPSPFAHEEEFLEWFVLRRIKSIGVLWNKNSVIWESTNHKIKSKADRAETFKRLLEKGKISVCNIEGGTEDFYITTEDKKALDKVLDCKEKEVRFLAPLDNLLWERSLIERIFNFTYTWEVYTPAAKRKYGYYVLPILYGTSLAGRFEPAADRKGKKLNIKNIWYENNFHADKNFTEAYEQELSNFCNFLSVKPPLDGSLLY